MKYDPSKLGVLLKTKNINPNQLARILNTDRQRVYAWLDGKQPQADCVRNMEIHFDLDRDYFFMDSTKYDKKK